MEIMTKPIDPLVWKKGDSLHFELHARRLPLTLLRIQPASAFSRHCRTRRSRRTD